MTAEDIWAKSAGKGASRGESLATHTDHVLQSLRQWRTRLPFLGELCQDTEFWDRVELTLLLHDVGKCAKKFQRMLRGGPPFGHRHEVFSCAILPAVLTRESSHFKWVAAGILSHHRDLRQVVRLYPDDNLALVGEEIGLDFLSRASEYFERFLAPLASPSLNVGDLSYISSRLSPDSVWGLREALVAYRKLFWELENKPATHAINLQALFLRGIVQLCDHAGSAHVPVRIGSGEFLNRILGELPAERLFPHQKEAFAAIGNVILNAPTGSGKTEAALLWASNQESTGSPALFYVLPYQASLNAMRRRMEKNFGEEEVVLQHSKSVEALFRMQLDKGYTREDAASSARRERQLAGLYARPIRILTPYQLLRGPFQLSGHEALATDSSGGLFVLDEIHAYEPYRLGMMLAFFRRLHRFQAARLFVMSATMPEIMRRAIDRFVGVSGWVNADENTVEKFRRHSLRVLQVPLVSDTVAEQVAEAYRKGKSVLLVATTVARSQDLRERIQHLIGPLERVDLLHGKFCARDRFEKEIAIAKKVGRQLDPASRKPALLVATQVVEVSLDLDFDLLYSDPAPLDALIQRFGRVNRGKRALEMPVFVSNHVPEECPVYDAEIVSASLDILKEWDRAILDDALLRQGLDRIYSGYIANWWELEVEKGVKEFERDVLDSWRAFESQDDLESLFEEMFDGVQVLPRPLVGAYRELMKESPIEAGSLVVPVSNKQFAILKRQGRISRLPDIRHAPPVAEVEYSVKHGLELNNVPNETE